MTVVVTGASGFIGSVLVRELLARGRPVRAVVHETAAELEGLGIELVQGDVRDPESLATAFAGAESVFHLAAVISLAGDLGGRVTETNVAGARNAARAALDQGVGRFVHFSSIHAFDLTDPEATIRENSARVGLGHPIYDRTKAAGEAAVREVIAEGLDGVIVHPSGVLGPGDHRPSRIGRVLLDLEARRLPALLPGGFDWVDVRDVVAGALAAEERGRTNESYLLSGSWHSARELADCGAEVTGVGAPRTTLPMWLGRSLAPFGDFWGWLTRSEPRLTSDALVALRAAGDIRHSKAGEELGHRPRPIGESVRDAYRWFSEAGMLRRPLAEPEGRE